MLRSTLGFITSLSLVFVACGGNRPAPTASVTPGSPSPRAVSSAAVDGPCVASQRVIGTLKRPLRIDAELARGTPALDRFAAEMEKLLERYRRTSNAKLGTSTAVAKDEASMRLVLSSGEESEEIKALPVEQPEYLELLVASRLRAFVDRVDGVSRSIGVLTGHGERRLDTFDLVFRPASGEQASMASIVRKYFPHYRFVDVDLAGGDREIDGTLEGLIVLQPSADLTEKELRRIDAFVMKGKSLVVAASAANVSRSGGFASARVGAHRLDRLLAGYGIVLNEDVVIDFGNHFNVKVQTPNGVMTMRFPQVPQPSDDAIDDRFPPLFRIRQLALPFASSVAVNPAAQPKAKVRVVARTSDRAHVEKFPDVDVSVARRWTVPRTFGQFPIGAAAEGDLKSAFGTETSARPARVLLLASASAFANPFVAPGPTIELEDQLAAPYAQTSLANTFLVLKNTLDWMAGGDDLASCAPPSR